MGEIKILKDNTIFINLKEIPFQKVCDEAEMQELRKEMEDRVGMKHRLEEHRIET